MTEIKPDLVRRRLALTSLVYPASLLLQSCVTPFARLKNSASTPDAAALLSKSAAAHGSVAFSNVQDISVSYAGRWRAVVGKLQPALVDSGFRGGSEERLLFSHGILSQAHSGTKGSKQVVRSRAPLPAGEVQVWRNGKEDFDKDARDAAALVADGYCLFLLGPMLISSHWLMERALTMELDGIQRIQVDSKPYNCDLLRIRMRTGFGFAAEDDMTLFIDQGSHLMRKVRFTLNGLESTRGAVAEVDVARYTDRFGINWPTYFYERLLRPVPLPVHEWRMMGLDLNRGLEPIELTGATFLGKAIAPAAKILLES